MSDETYRAYRTKEMCKLAGISRSTYLRWVKTGVITDVKQWDRRGWRLFNPGDIARIREEVHRIASQ
jgi:excisionase family DNA binding protein